MKRFHFIVFLLFVQNANAEFCSLLSLPDKSHVIYGACKELNSGQLESLRSSYTSQLKKNDVYPYNHVDSIGGIWSPTPTSVVNNAWVNFQFEGVVPSSAKYVQVLNEIRKRSAQLNLNRYRPVELILADEIDIANKSAINIAIRSCIAKFGDVCNSKLSEAIALLRPLKEALIKENPELGISLLNKLILQVSKNTTDMMSEILFTFLKQHFITSSGQVKGLAFVPSRNFVAKAPLGDLNTSQVMAIIRSNQFKYLKSKLLSSCYKEDFKRPCFMIEGTVDRDRFVLLRQMAAYLDDVIELLSWITIHNAELEGHALAKMDFKVHEAVVSKFRILFSDLSTIKDIEKAKSEIKTHLNRKSAFVSRVYRRLFRLDSKFISNSVGAKRRLEIISGYESLSQRLHGDRNKIRYISTEDPVFMAMSSNSNTNSFYPEVKTSLNRDVKKELVCMDLEVKYPKLSLMWHTHQGSKLYDAIISSKLKTSDLRKLINSLDVALDFKAVLRKIRTAQ